MKPVIGVMPLWDEEKESLWMLPGYMDGIRMAGGIPVMFPLTSDADDLQQLVATVDGILFTGGQDVTPELYGQQPLDDSVVCCRERDEMERLVLEFALKGHKSILGICRGIQFLNVALGGTLYQDLPTQHLSETEHHQSAPYDIPIHKVKVLEGTPLRHLLGVETLSVNSLHHQAIRVLAPGLTVMAESEDGLIEGICKPDEKFFWAVQWHPEFAYASDEAERKIFEAFVESMK